MNAVTRLTLAGCGVVLLPLETAQANELVLAASDGALWNLQTTIVPDASSVAAYIGNAIAGRDQGTVLPFAIQREDTGRIVGSTRFWKVNPAHRKAEIGYTWMAKTSQGTFVNPAIKYLMLRYAFETFRAVRVQFQTDETNAHSRAAILKLGAKEEGILRNERIMPNGRLRNSARFSIIDSEWASVRDGLEQRLRALGIAPSYRVT